MTVSTQKILSPEEIAVRAGEQQTFLHLPEPGVFAERALRLRQLAAGHAMRDFLLFVAELAEAQHRALSTAAPVMLPTPAQIEQARNLAREGGLRFGREHAVGVAADHQRRAGRRPGRPVLD